MSLLGLAQYDSDSDQSVTELNTKEYDGNARIIENFQTTEEPCSRNDHSIQQSQIRQNNEILDIVQQVADSEENFEFLSKMPPIDPEIQPDPNSIANVKYYLDAIKLHEFDLTENIRNNRDFGNPYIMLNVVEHFKIDELGSNYPTDMFNPHGYPQCDFVENLVSSSMPSAAQPAAALSVLPGQPTGAQQQAPLVTATAILSQLTQQLQQTQSSMHRSASYNQQLVDVALQSAHPLSVSNSVSNFENMVTHGAVASHHHGASNSFRDTAGGDTVGTTFGKKRKSRFDSTVAE